MTDTKIIQVRGASYTIKRWSFGEGTTIDEFAASNKDNFKGQQVLAVSLGVVEPKFTIEEWQKEDFETVARLWYELQEFNKFDTTFLLLLKNSSQQVTLQDVTRLP